MSCSAFRVLFHRSCLHGPLAALLYLGMASAWALEGGPSVQPLVLKPRGSEGASDASSLEALRERLEEKLGAKTDPASGDRVLRVVNRAKAAPRPPVRPTKPKAADPSDVVARASLAAHEGAAEAAGAGDPRPARDDVITASAQPGAARSPVSWDYHGAGAPSRWGKLDPAYGACATGKRQSPIYIRDGIQVQLDPLVFSYQPSAFTVIDTGRTVQVDVAPGNFLSIDGHRYELVEFHFHRPAEDVVEGKRYDMVIHMLHRDAEGRLAMLAVLLDKGAAQPVVQTVWNNLPLEQNRPVQARVTLDPAQLLPKEQNYYTYMGSLTMPPCTEGVRWVVLRRPMTVSDEQIDIFSRLYPMNARPLQDASNRLIKQN